MSEHLSAPARGRSGVLAAAWANLHDLGDCPVIAGALMSVLVRLGGRAAVLAGIAIVAGCGNTSSGGPPSGSASAPASAAPSAAAPPADGPLTLEQYEQLLTALAACKAVESESNYFGSVEGSCPAYKALNDARNRKDALRNVSGKTGPLARKLLKHEAPAVRVQAAGMMESLLGTDAENQKAILDLAKSEKDPAVLKALLHAVWNEGKKNPAIGSLLLSLAAHENPRVRATAAVGISSSWNKGMPGAVEKLIELMEKDRDAKTRQAACAYAGEHDDPRLVDAYTKLLGPKTDPELAGKCFEGLLKMWASYPLFANANEKAYRLSLKFLAQKPRSEKLPPWTTMGTFENVGNGKGAAFDKWKGQAKWFDPKESRKLMLEIVADKQAGYLARTGAVKAAAALGASKAELGAVQKKLGADDKQVVTAIERVLPTLK